MFLSDNGMAFPFAKTNCYLHQHPHAVDRPLARAKSAPGTVDHDHFISGIDLMPTVLEAAGVCRASRAWTAAPSCRCCAGSGRTAATVVFTQFHQTSARRNYPMRCVQNRRFGYIFNPWSDGSRIFQNESQDGPHLPRHASRRQPTILRSMPGSVLPAPHGGGVLRLPDGPGCAA